MVRFDKHSGGEYLRHYLSRVRQFIGLIGSQYQEKECQKSAASLTYMTLFATVPLMTVTYSMFSVIPSFQGLGDELQQLIFAHVLPDTGQELVSYLKDFSSQARKLTLLGVLFLVVSAYLMLTNIETNFNAIWGVRRGRKGVANFLLYWAVLSLGPLLLGLALAISTYLVSLRILMDGYEGLGLITWTFQFAPVLLSAAAFTLLFAAVPNCRVPVSHALIGGVVTALIFEALKTLFGLIVTNSSLTLIYGAFAIVPLFLLWVNMIWMVILMGAVLVRTIGIYQIVLKDRAYPDLFAALVILWQFQLAASRGHSLTDRHLLQLGFSSGQWQRIRDTLQKQRVLTMTQQGDLVLCLDLHHLTLKQLAGMLKISRQLPVDARELENLPWLPAAKERLGAVDSFTDERWSITVADFFVANDVMTDSGDPGKNV